MKALTIGRSSNWWDIIFQGSCVPGKKLPTVKRIKDTENILVGYANKEGCFSARLMKNGKIDVAIYDTDPRTVALALSEGSTWVDAAYYTLEEIPGWGYLACQMVKERG